MLRRQLPNGVVELRYGSEAQHSQKWLVTNGTVQPGKLRAAALGASCYDCWKASSFLSFPFRAFRFLSCPVLSCPFLSCPALPFPSLPFPSLPFPSLPFPSLQLSHRLLQCLQ